jgi:hypothetical protein
LIWLRIGTDKCGKEPSGSIKCLKSMSAYTAGVLSSSWLVGYKSSDVPSTLDVPT